MTTKTPGQKIIYCKTKEKRELLEEKIKLAIGLTASEKNDIYSVLVKSLDMFNNSLLRQEQLKNNS